MKYSTRLLSVFAIAGAVLMIVGTFLHPMHADPNVAVEAFQEYSESKHWIASHLMQLFGFVFITGTMVLLFVQVQTGPAKEWAILGLAGAVTSLGMASALQAVDGIALKAMVDAWAAAPANEKTGLFHAALGVRKIEIGLASISSVLSGLTFMAYGMAFLKDGRSPKWMAALVMSGGLLTFISGIVIAYTGFSPLSMTINMPSSLLIVMWLLAVSIKCWGNNLFIYPEKPH